MNLIKLFPKIKKLNIVKYLDFIILITMILDFTIYFMFMLYQIMYFNQYDIGIAIIYIIILCYKLFIYKQVYTYLYIQKYGRKPLS